MAVAPAPVEGVLPLGVQRVMNLLLRYRQNRQFGMIQINFKHGEITTLHETRVMFGEGLTPQPPRPA